MSTLYLSAGQTKFTYTGTYSYPISSFSKNIKVIREERDSPGLYKSFFTELAHLIPQHFYFLTPNKTYIISTLSAFTIEI